LHELIGLLAGAADLHAVDRREDVVVAIMDAVRIFEIHLDPVIALDPLAHIRPRHRKLGIDAGMKRHDMETIDHVLDALQPIAVDVAGAEDFVALRVEEQVIIGEFRRWLRPDIGEDHARDLAHGIGALPHLVLEVAEGGLARLIEALALCVVEPAVIAAAQALLLDAAVFERGIAVAAMLVEEAKLAIAGAEQHEFLVHQLDDLRLLAEMLGKHDRPPIAAQHVARRRARPDPRQRLVLGLFHCLLPRAPAKREIAQ
jgi:hypothetical protein